MQELHQVTLAQAVAVAVVVQEDLQQLVVMAEMQVV